MFLPAGILNLASPIGNSSELFLAVSHNPDPFTLRGNHEKIKGIMLIVITTLITFLLWFLPLQQHPFRPWRERGISPPGWRSMVSS